MPLIAIETLILSPTCLRIRHNGSTRTPLSSHTPVEDPAVYANIWDGFVKHMAEITGKEVVFFPVQSNAAQLEAMRSRNRLHVAASTPAPIRSRLAAPASSRLR